MTETLAVGLCAGLLGGALGGVVERWIAAALEHRRYQRILRRRVRDLTRESFAGRQLW